jgi:hypothetical protein
MQAAEAGGKGEGKGGSQAIARQSLLFSLEMLRPPPDGQSDSRGLKLEGM